MLGGMKWRTRLRSGKVEKSLPLASLQPGKYQVSIKVNDAVTKQQTVETQPFSVN